MGPFEIVSILGRGGMGVVYRAREDGTGREVALKLAVGGSAVQLERIRREGAITAGLEHSNIVKLHTAGEFEGKPYLVYELVEDARTLHSVCQTLSTDAVLGVICDAARAVGHAHANGVVHRDLKPDNLLIDADDRVRVADFGLAQANDLDRLTRTGAIVGTPLFMAPEQLFAELAEIGPYTDVWALGVILYQSLTGRLPFNGENFLAQGLLLLKATPKPVRSLAPTVSPSLEAVCLKALERDATQRYVDANAMADDLEAALAGRAVSAELRAGSGNRRTAIGVAALVAGLVIAAGVWRASNDTIPAAALDGDPPVIEAELLPRDPWTEHARLRGKVSDAADRVTLTAGGVTTDVRAGRFRLEIPVAIGDQAITLTATDPAGNSSRRSWPIDRVYVPEWYLALPERHRPPVPLPDGMAFGASEGEYLSDPSRTVLVWVWHGGGQGGFFIGKHEVTRAQYRAFCEATGRAHPDIAGNAPPDDHPVTRVSYEDARAYSAWAGLRVPKDSEWVRAARGPDDFPYPWGEEPLRERANVANVEDGDADGGDPYSQSNPVDAFPLGASGFGCLGMLGNVREWVEREDAPNPLAPLAAARGSCFDAKQFSLHRHQFNPIHRNYNLGFRVAR